MSTPSHNAADGYRAAVKLLPVFTDDEQADLERALTFPLNRTARRLMDRCDSATTAWLEAATTKRCTWNGDYTSSGFNQLLFEMSRARRMIQLLCLRVRDHCSRHEVDRAIEILDRMFVSARHVGLARLYIMRLCQWSIELWTFDTAASQLPGITSDACQELVDRFRKAPDSCTLRESAAEEKQFENAQASWPIDAMRTSDYERFLPIFCSSEETEEILGVAGRDIESLSEMARKTVPLIDLVGEVMMLPESDFHVVIGALKSKLRVDNPMVIQMANVAEKMRFGELRNQVKSAQFRAGVARRLNDRVEFEQWTDPATGLPFEMNLFRGGFDLHSTFRRDGVEPVRTRFGQECGLIPWFRRLWAG